MTGVFPELDFQTREKTCLNHLTPLCLEHVAKLT